MSLTLGLNVVLGALVVLGIGGFFLAAARAQRREWQQLDERVHRLRRDAHLRRSPVVNLEPLPGGPRWSAGHLARVHDGSLHLRRSWVSAPGTPGG